MRSDDIDSGDSPKTISLPGRRRSWKRAFWALGLLMFIGAVYIAQKGEWTLAEDPPAGAGSLVGTSGVDPRQVPLAGDSSRSDAVLRDDGILAALERPQQLIGRRITIENVDIGRRTNDVAFWVGETDRRLLVVYARDTRTGRGRLLGEPSSHPAAPIADAARTAIVGTIEPIPYPEAMASWGLTTRERAELAGLGVYVRVQEVIAGGH